MHYRRLGRSGLKVSEISLGAWVTFGGQVDEQKAADLIHAAYDQGVNYFDNADVYANGQAEVLMGKAVAGIPREALVISSKVFWPSMPGPNGRGLSRKHVRESVEASLKRLNLDYLDLYFCHRYDSDTPADELVFTMNDLIRQGKILYWGTSEWEPHQIMEVIGAARALNLVGPSMEQPRYNLLHRKRVENFLSPLCRDQGIGLTTFSPLEQGVLTGKYNDGIPQGSRASIETMAWMRDRITPERIAITRQLSELAGELGCTPSQLALAWVLRRKEVSSVITGASTLEQLDENLGAAEVEEKLTDALLERIEQILGNFPE